MSEERGAIEEEAEREKRREVRNRGDEADSARISLI